MRRAFIPVLLCIATSACASDPAPTRNGDAAPPFAAPLPDRGLAVATETGVDLYDLGGRKLASLDGFDLQRSLRLRPGPRIVERGKRQFVATGGERVLASTQPGTVHLGYGYRLHTTSASFRLMRGRRRISDLAPADLDFTVSYQRDVVTGEAEGRSTIFDLATGARRDALPGCRVADGRYVICDRHSGASFEDNELRDVTSATNLAPAPDHGFWRHASISPDGATLVLQHSGECEVPTVYILRLPDGPATPLADGAEALHLGWAPDGRAVVHFTEGACGEAVDRPGIYLVDGEHLEFAFALPAHRYASMWAPLGLSAPR